MCSRLRKPDYCCDYKIPRSASSHNWRYRNKVSSSSGNVIESFSDFYEKIIMKSEVPFKTLR